MTEMPTAHTNHEKPKKTVDCKNASLASAMTYWSHDPYAEPGSDNARIADISKTFIDLFYKSLLKKQCRVATGVEIESAFTSTEPDMLENVALYLTEQHIKPGDETWFEKSKQVGEKGIATKRNGIYRVYEDGEALEITTWPYKPLETVAYVKSIKKMLVESTREFAETAPNHTPSQSATNYGHAMIEPPRQVEGEPTKAPPHPNDLLHATKLRFGKIKKSDTKTALSGEHLNISLHRTNDDCSSSEFDLAAANKSHKEIGILLGETLDQHTKADSLLLHSCPASMDRMNKKYVMKNNKQYVQMNHDTNWMAADKGHELKAGEASRIEWSAPDSASDIHVTMLTAMSATYALMKALHKATGAVMMPQNIHPHDHFWIMEALKKNIPMPTEPACTQQERVTQFQENSMVLKMMKQVVKENVPELEQEHYNALISEFEAAAIRQSNRQFATAPDISNAR